MARLVTNVGQRAHFLLASHSAWEDQPGSALAGTVLTDGTNPLVFPFLNEEVAPSQEVVNPALARGFPGRAKPIGGIQSAEGTIATAISAPEADSSHLGALLAWITGTPVPTGTLLLGGDILASGQTVTHGVAVVPATGKHPKDLVKDPGSGPPTPHSCALSV